VPAERRILVEGDDYYREGAALVFTARYHLRRGYCCASGCRHCPFAEGKRGKGEGGKGDWEANGEGVRE